MSSLRCFHTLSLVSVRSRLSHCRYGYTSLRYKVLVGAESDPKKDTPSFDEGAAQVRRLMERDRSKFAGPDFEVLLEKQFAEESTVEIPSGKEESESSISQQPTVASPKAISPFGSSAKSEAISPFGSSAKPLNEPKGLKPDMDYDLTDEIEEPWWNFFKNVTLTQIVLFCSFTLIITTMLGTFAFVFKSGGIHFNE